VETRKKQDRTEEIKVVEARDIVVGGEDIAERKMKCTNSQ
jgi:hypothetical protein